MSNSVGFSPETIGIFDGLSNMERLANTFRNFPKVLLFSSERISSIFEYLNPDSSTIVSVLDSKTFEERDLVVMSQQQYLALIARIDRAKIGEITLSAQPPSTTELPEALENVATPILFIAFMAIACTALAGCIQMLGSFAHVSSQDEKSTGSTLLYYIQSLAIAYLAYRYFQS